MTSVILKKGRERRLVAGHAWVYTGEIDSVSGDPADGGVVDIRDARKRFLGCGWFNRRSQITVRRFSTHKEDPDRAFFQRRIAAALQHRRRLGHDPADPQAAFRVVSSEADLVPGLILDKYGDCLVLQTLTLGVDQRRDLVLAVVEDLLHPRAIVERNDVATRKLEGLLESRGVLRGQTDGKQVIRVGGPTNGSAGAPSTGSGPDGAPSQRPDGVGPDRKGEPPGEPIPLEFEVNLLEDQKTGFYLDQQANQGLVARHAAGRRVLDCFSYHGGFALTAARAGAAGVESIEISEAAVARARRNAKRNALTGRLEFVCKNAFDVLKQYDTQHQRFDLVVLDPPSFTRNKQSVADAVRGYKEINLRALKLLPIGGLLATFSCSHHVPADLL